MGVKTTLAGTTPAAGHLSAALSKGRIPAVQIAQAQEQAAELIITLKEIVKDMQNGDGNITAFNTLITNLS